MLKTDMPRVDETSDRTPRAGADSSNDLARRTLAIVLAGGRGTRLGPLTRDCAKPAVHFGGRFRIIDFTLANCVNSGLRRVAVLTQYKAQTLLRHLHEHWTLPRRLGEFIEAVPAQQRVGDAWYAGTADAVRQNTELIEALRPDFVLVLGGDHVYKMDYTKLLGDHVASTAEVTVACVEVPVEDAGALGVVEVDAFGRIVDWHEKPRVPRPMRGSPHVALASMGIYVFDTTALRRELAADMADGGSAHDFGHDVVPRMLRAGRVVGMHAFSRSCVAGPGARPYWRDVGTVDAYWEANIDLTREGQGCDLFERTWSIPGGAQASLPNRFKSDGRGRPSVLMQTLLGDGCTIGAAELRGSVVFSDVRIGDGAQIEESLLLPHAEIGAGVRLRRVIVDRHCRLPAGLTAGFDAEQDRRRYHVTPRGITLITPDMLGGPQAGPDRPGRSDPPVQGEGRRPAREPL